MKKLNKCMVEYEIYTTYNEKPFCFVGKYRRDLESQNWHYYEQENGKICHFRKQHIIAVFGDTYESIKYSKMSK